MMMQRFFRRYRTTYGNTVVNIFGSCGPSSGEEAIDAARQIKLANDEIALFLSDQRMPGMTGVEFLKQRQTIVSQCETRLVDGLC